MSLFNELKRRNVFRVGAAYLIASWLMTEVSSVLLPTFGAPDWVLRVIVLLLVIGFPVAVTLSWVYELTPEGIKLERDVDRSRSITPNTGNRLNLITIALVAFGVGFVLLDRFVLEQPSPPIGVDDSARSAAATTNTDDAIPSIAVLPFVNMSSDAEQEYFSDGITEEILNALVKVPGVAVAARTSAFSYKGQSKDIRLIGEELGVANVVEGSVRKAGDELRITAQLIRVSDGFHLWSETYDRRMENVFALQEEIARAIADALQAPLGLETVSLVQHQTRDMQAYQVFLQSRQWIRERDLSLEKAISGLRDVTRRDPEYAPAWAYLSIALGYAPAYLVSLDGDPLDPYFINALAEHTARRSVALGGDMAEGYYALANALRLRRVWAEAEDAYLKALELDPSSIEILEDYRQFLQSVGRLNESVSWARKAYELEPNSALAAVTLADSLYFVRRPDEALSMAERALRLQPGFSWPMDVIQDIQVGRGEFDAALDAARACPLCAGKLGGAERVRLIGQIADGETPNLEELVAVLSPDLWLSGGGEAGLKAGIENWTDIKQDIPMWATSWNDPYMDQLRTTDWYKMLMVRTGLVDYWRERGWPDYCQRTSDFDFECGAYRPSE